MVKSRAQRKFRGKRGREISEEAGKISDRKVCYFAGRTGIVEILNGILKLKSNQ